MSRDDIQKIKERLGVKELIESYIKIEKAGKNWKARCPFHNEKSPSFFISPERDSYYCFGCGAKGDIFSFVQEFESTDFSGALKILAEKTGIKITNYSKESESRTKRMYEILEVVTNFYERNLNNNKEAIEYLKLRGLKEETIKEWRIGFALSDWRSAYTYLRGKGYGEEEIDKVGLIKKGERGDYYDRFRNRIMFPIFDSSGRPIAFSGRIFGAEEDVAKYVNSPETELFKKSETLYGLHKAKNSIRKNNFSILVEGQMDLLMCHQANYTNTVASSGTALTEKQLEMISRISKRMVIAYDSDNAGFKASERAWGMALALGMDIKLAPMSQGQDPADVIKESLENWKNTIKNSKHIIEVLVDKILDIKVSDREKGQLVSERIIPYLSQIKSDIDRDHFIKKVSESFNLREETVIAEIKSLKELNKHDNLKIDTSDENSRFNRSKDEMAVEKRLFGILYSQESSKNPTINPKELEDKIREILEKDYTFVTEKIKTVIDEIVYAAENTFENKGKLEKEIKELLSNLNLKYLNRKREKLVLELKKMEVDKSEDEENRLLTEISEISKKIQKISQSL